MQKLTGGPVIQTIKGVMRVTQGDRRPNMPVLGNERDDAPAEPSARHPRPERAVGEQRFDRGVELDDAHPVVVAQRFVRGGQQRPDLGKRCAAQQVDRAQHPFVLGDDVSGVMSQVLARESVQGRVEVGHGQFAERTQPKDLRGAFTAGSAQSVFAVCMPVCWRGCR